MISEFIPSPNGEIFVIRNEPKQVNATLVMVHGLGEHIERYIPLMEYFADFGIQTIGFDQRGFGRSMEKGHKKGYSTFEMVHEDILFVSNKYRVEGKKHFLMGHSMGGGLVLQFALAHPLVFDGVIASGPMIRPGSSSSPNFIEKFGLAHLPKLWGSLVIPNYLDVSNLSRDPAVIAAYKSTPLNHPMAGVTLLSQLIFKGEELITDGVTRFTTPLLLTHGCLDTLTDPTATKEFYEKCPSKDKEIKIFEGYLHEMHNEPEEFKKPVFELYSAWLSKRF